MSGAFCERYPACPNSSHEPRPPRCEAPDCPGRPTFAPMLARHIYPPTPAEALRTAITHIEHMAKFIKDQNAGYSFESLGEDMPGIRDALKSLDR